MFKSAFTPRILLLLLVVVAIATTTVTVRRAARGSNDFDTYYYTGRAVIEKNGIYYKGDYYQDAFPGGPFLYAPVMACFFSLLALMPLPAAAAVWNLMNLFLFFMCLRLSARLLGLPGPGALFNRNPVSLAAAGFLFFILLDNLTMAQVNIFILFLLLAGLTAWQKEKSFAAGSALAAAIFIKLTPLLFCVFFAVRKSWKVLAGVAAGAVILAAIIPTLFFGLEKNSLYHRQWLGRMIKPVISKWVPGWQKEKDNPFKLSPEEVESIRLTNLFVDKNQSLEGALTRLFLKNRNSYAYDTKYPIYAGQRYSRMPVLGGLPPTPLRLSIRVLQAAFFLYLMVLLAKRKRPEEIYFLAVQLSLVFLSMTLLSPMARSHQFIFWTLPVVTFLYLFQNGLASKMLKWGAGAAALLYVLQAVPYGKAAGMGAWANLTLWACFAVLAAKKPELERMNA